MLLALVLAVGGLLFFEAKKESPLGASQAIDNCVVFDQVSSRSSKDVILARPGKVYSFNVTSTATLLRYFQLHDQTTAPTGVSTPELSIPIGGTTASATPVQLTIVPGSAMKFDTGIAFGISNQFATFATQSDQLYRNSYFVTVCSKDI